MSEDELSDGEAISDMLWRAFCLGVNIRNELFVNRFENANDGPTHEMRALRDVSGLRELWEGVNALLRRIAEGQSTLVRTPEEPLPEWLEQMETERRRRHQELAQRLVEHVDRKQKELKKTRRSRQRRGGSI